MTASTRNPDRAKHARAVLQHYAGACYAEDMTVELWDDYAADLLADLMHLADTIERDITDPLTSAENNYHAEVEGDDLTEDDDRMHAAELADPYRDCARRTLSTVWGSDYAPQRDTQRDECADCTLRDMCPVTAAHPVVMGELARRAARQEATE